MKKFRAATEQKVTYFYSVIASDEESAREKILDGSDDVEYLGEEPSLNQEQKIIWIEEIEE